MVFAKMWKFLFTIFLNIYKGSIWRMCFVEINVIISKRHIFDENAKDTFLLEPNIVIKIFLLSYLSMNVTQITRTTRVTEDKMVKDFNHKAQVNTC